MYLYNMITILNNLSINKLNLNVHKEGISRPSFKGTEIDSKKTHIPESYGRVLVTQKYISKREPTKLELLEEELSRTSNSDDISLESATKELSSLNLSNKKITDIILACTFENDNPEIKINKKALLITKETLLYDGKLPAKYTDAIRGSLDEETEAFNPQKYESMFNARGAIKITAKIKSNPTNYDKTLREVKRKKKQNIQQYVEDHNVQEKSYNFKTSSLFIPIEEQTQPLLTNIKKNEDLPDSLKKEMTESVQNGNFDLKTIYTNHYSLLDECKNLDEVKKLYPELEYPSEKPSYNKSKSSKDLSNRLSNEDFDNVIITTLSKIHKDLRPTSNMYIEFQNSPATTFISMRNAGYGFSTPSKETLAILKQGDNLKQQIDSIPNYTDDEIKKIANKHSIRTSNVWGDYHELTSKSWIPVRLIKNKRNNPETSKYKTEKLVNSYLYNLYQTDKNEQYSSNPLEKLGELNYANKDVRNVINKTYWTRFKEDDERIENRSEFNEFKKKFNQEKIGKSIESMENNYTKAFFSLYWTPKRVENLKRDMQNSYDLIYEKIILKEQTEPKKITDNDVKELIEDDLSMDIPEKIEDDKLSKFKFKVQNINNKGLKERCLSSINDGENSDLEYFNTINGILEKSTEDGVVNEDKASVLINLHDKYLNSIIKSNNSETEDDFIDKELEKYRKTNGEIDYEKANKATLLESEYFKRSAKMEQKGEGELNSIIEERFIFNENENYEDANKVLEYYENIPKTFKPKYAMVLKKSCELDNKDFLKTATDLHDKITSWNYDNDEEIIMDRDKIPQKVIITHNAKEGLLKSVHGNMELFDSYLKKFYSAGQTRTGNKGGQGIKTIPGSGYDAEIKIKGTGGDIRMYTRPVTNADQAKYSYSDGINVKYIFDTCGEHL